MPLSVGDIIAVLSLLLTSGVGAYLAIYTRRANRALTEAQAAKTVTESRRVKAEAADVLVDASSDVVRQLREQMHQLEVNAAYDKERIDDLQRKAAKSHAASEKAAEKLAAAETEIARLAAEKAYDREQIDDLQRKSAELRLNLERAVEELAAAQLEIRCLVAEKDSQAKQIHTLETTVQGLTNENLVLRDRLAKYEQKGGDCD